MVLLARTISLISCSTKKLYESMCLETELEIAKHDDKTLRVVFKDILLNKTCN
jgi:hypothetical protein